MATLLSTAALIADKYEVLSLLGEGRGGAVYKVRHTELNTIRALKVLPQHLGKNPDLAQRFYREARVMARLTAPPHGHPNIVRVLDIGHDAVLDSHYFVMEYLRGQTLRDHLRHTGALPLSEVFQITRQIALALDFAHQQVPPIIHRDIKPANIMLEDDSGRAVLMDFGIAKELEEGELTKTGVALGTIRYCAPEQLRHEPLTGAADIYALGMVMYEAYTGQQFFGDLTEHQVIGQLLYEEREPELHLPPSTPLAFAAVVQKAIAKDPKHRYAEMNGFLSALEDCAVRTEDTQTLPLRNTPYRRTNSSHSLDTLEKQIQYREQERHQTAPSPDREKPWELGTDDVIQGLDLSGELPWTREASLGGSVKQVGRAQREQQSGHAPLQGWRQKRGRWRVVLVVVLILGAGSLLWVANHRGEGFTILLSPLGQQQGFQLEQGKQGVESAQDRQGGNASALPAEEPPAVENRRIEVQGYLAVGNLYMNRGKYRQAVAEFEKARTLQPTNRAVLEHLQAAHSAWAAEKKLGLIPDG